MDTISTSVSSLKVSSLPSLTTPHELLFFKPPNPSQLPPHSHLYAKPTSVTNKHTSSFTHKKTLTSDFHSTQPTQPFNHASPIFHKKATSGYAAALLDMAQSNNTLDAVERDVTRFLRLTRSVTSMEDKMKGQVLKDFAEKGRFQRILVVLVKMLVQKNKVVLVNGVLEEFKRIYDEWNGTLSGFGFV